MKTIPLLEPGSPRNKKVRGVLGLVFEINNFVKKLTEKPGFEDEVPEITDTKFRALKKIIEYYDIKNLDRS